MIVTMRFSLILFTISSALAQAAAATRNDGTLFLGTNDTYMLDVDQKTGRLLWRTNVADMRPCGCNITDAPLVVKDKVLVGGTGGDGAHRGYITAFYTKNGRLAWRWYVIP